MNRQIALAYGVAGLAVAIAFVTVVAGTLGFSEAATPAPTATESPLASVDPAARHGRRPSRRHPAARRPRGRPADPERRALAGC